MEVDSAAAVAHGCDGCDEASSGHKGVGRVEDASLPPRQILVGTVLRSVMEGQYARIRAALEPERVALLTGLESLRAALGEADAEVASRGAHVRMLEAEAAWDDRAREERLAREDAVAVELLQGRTHLQAVLASHEAMLAALRPKAQPAAAALPPSLQGHTNRADDVDRLPPPPDVDLLPPPDVDLLPPPDVDLLPPPDDALPPPPDRPSRLSPPADAPAEPPSGGISGLGSADGDPAEHAAAAEQPTHSKKVKKKK